MTSSVSIQESIVVYVKEVASSSATELKMHSDNDERWQTFFDMQKTKIKATEKTEERLLMATNKNIMSPKQKAYFAEERRRITKERAARVKEAEAAAQLAATEEEKEEDADDADK